MPELPPNVKPPSPEEIAAIVGQFHFDLTDRETDRSETALDRSLGSVEAARSRSVFADCVSSRQAVARSRVKLACR